MITAPIKTITGYSCDVVDSGVTVATLYAETREALYEWADLVQRARGMHDALIDVQDSIRTTGSVKAGSLIAEEVRLALDGSIYDEDGESEPSNVVMLR